MKKLLMCSAAVALGLAVAAPAKADGIKLDLAGHFKGYVTWLNEDTTAGATAPTERHLDILRETEIHFTGETTLDNGLTVGVHHEADIDSGDQDTANADLFVTEESYAYFSGGWGRVNFGKEDGANYLLEVAAPSADENFDGLRQYINPFNNALTQLQPATLGGQAGVGAGRGFLNTGKLDYSDDATGYSNKLTYLTPVWNGFQAGGSFTPSDGGNSNGALPIGGSSSTVEGSSAFGVHAVNNNPAVTRYGNAWEGAARYEGKFQELGVTLGGGYTHVDLEQSVTAVAGTGHAEDFNQWNIGANLNWQQFGLGGVYTRDNGGWSDNGNNTTWVVGLDYTTGPFKIGGSYLDNKEDLGEIATVDEGDVHTHRWAGGVVYTYGPGMTFRGSVGWVRSSTNEAADDVPDYDSTDVLLGTQINF